MQVANITDADRAFLERLAEDCRLILGPEIELQNLELATNDDIVFVCATGWVMRTGRAKDAVKRSWPPTSISGRVSSSTGSALVSRRSIESCRKRVPAAVRVHTRGFAYLP